MCWTDSRVRNVLVPLVGASAYTCYYVININVLTPWMSAICVATVIHGFYSFFGASPDVVVVLLCFRRQSFSGCWKYPFCCVKQKAHMCCTYLRCVWWSPYLLHLPLWYERQNGGPLVPMGWVGLAACVLSLADGALVTYMLRSFCISAVLSHEMRSISCWWSRMP